MYAFFAQKVIVQIKISRFVIPRIQDFDFEDYLYMQKYFKEKLHAYKLKI